MVVVVLRLQPRSPPAPVSAAPLPPGVNNPNAAFYGYLNQAGMIGMQPPLQLGFPAFVAPHPAVAAGMTAPTKPSTIRGEGAPGASGTAKGAPGSPHAARALSEKETKELRRKRANRESARRSKLRKKEEFESLARRAEGLATQGSALRTEIARMEGALETLTSQNETLRREVLKMCGNLNCLSGGAGQSAQGGEMEQKQGAEAALQSGEGEREGNGEGGDRNRLGLL